MYTPLKQQYQHSKISNFKIDDTGPDVYIVAAYAMVGKAQILKS
jgi:hypothetical protein